MFIETSMSENPTSLVFMLTLRPVGKFLEKFCPVCISKVVNFVNKNFGVP